MPALAITLCNLIIVQQWLTDALVLPLCLITPFALQLTHCYCYSRHSWNYRSSWRQRLRAGFNTRHSIITSDNVRWLSRIGERIGRKETKLCKVYCSTTGCFVDDGGGGAKDFSFGLGFIAHRTAPRSNQQLIAPFTLFATINHRHQPIMAATTGLSYFFCLPR